MPGKAVEPGAGGRPGEFAPTTRDREFLRGLQGRALAYFVENQAPCGLILDRQANRGPARASGVCSISATGMGLIALALAAAPPHRLITRDEAATRIRAALEMALLRLPADRGMMPHFVDAETGAVVGWDAISTVDSAWLLAGALWAAAALRDPGLQWLADQLFDRVDWAYWAAPGEAGPLLRHGKGADGRWLPARWDRLNGETIAMYVLAAGAEEGRALTAESWRALRPFYGTVAGHRFNNADLGLFVFQYGLDLLDLVGWQAPGAAGLAAEAAIAATANVEQCRMLASTFPTYQTYWGLSAGDGPGPAPAPDAYRDYAPAGPVDGTAHLTATLASVTHAPGAVLHNAWAGRHDRGLYPLGRYGFSSVNVGVAGRWVGSDMVAIDAGAAVLALENALEGGRVRDVFHALPRVRRGLDRLGFTRVLVRRAS